PPAWKWLRHRGLRGSLRGSDVEPTRCDPTWPLSGVYPRLAPLRNIVDCKQLRVGQIATWGMVQMRVTPGPQNQAQRTQSVSPIGLVVNGLHCAASHTHDFSQVSPSPANF